MCAEELTNHECDDQVFRVSNLLLETFGAYFIFSI